MPRHPAKGNQAVVDSFQSRGFLVLSSFRATGVLPVGIGGCLRNIGATGGAGTSCPPIAERSKLVNADILDATRAPACCVLREYRFVISANAAKAVASLPDA